ncbi:MAG: DUF559 domain-containing protein, partial [Solirubrobacterales bacterium]|nr:DUF559 domain-containing protein [Solirubrobacterales bacterium]
SGVSKRAIEYRVLTGRLHPEFRGVYSVGCGELPPLAREQAALLACGEHAFLTHHTSAFIWGLRKAHPFEVELSVLGRSCASRKGIRVHRIRQIDRREVRRHDSLWVSSPARALLEIASTLSPGELASAIDDGLAAGVLKRGEVEEVLERNRPCRGAERLAAVIAHGAGAAITRSRAEGAFLTLIRDARLPTPDVNEPFGRWEADFMWRPQRLVVEIDGYGFHSGPRAFNRDHEKVLALQAAGFEVLRFTRDQVVKRPAFVVATVAAALARRSVNGGQ